MTKPTVSKHWRKPVGRQRLGLNLTRTTPPCYNNTTLGNRLYAQRKGHNVTNPICWACNNCSCKCAAWLWTLCDNPAHSSSDNIPSIMLTKHCEPKKTHQNVLSYLPQNPVDSGEIWYTLSWINFRYISLDAFQLSWTVSLHYLVILSVRVL